MSLYLNKHIEREKRIVNDCLQNSRSAQYELYQTYCDSMYSICYRITGNEDDAHEALQDAFIQIFRDLKQFQFKSTLGAWIKTIVVRTAIKIVNNEKNIIFSPIEEVNENEVFVIPSTIDGELLEKAILSLPIGYKTVFLLIEVEGYTHEEVAKMLNISPGTSKSQLHRAKKMLQKKIGNLYN